MNSSHVQSARHEADQAVDQASRSKTLERLARAGYAARGVVYIVVGFIALVAAFGDGGEQATGSRGALVEMLDAPGGKLVLTLVALGLVGFAIWRAFQSLADADGRGKEGKALAIRLAQGGSAVVHFGLALYALYLAWGISIGGGGGGGNGAASLSAKLMQQPFGQWLVGLLGAAIIAGGAAQFVSAVRGKFKQRLAADHDKMKWISPLGRAGLSARGVVFFIIGGFFIVAAYQAQPEEARGLGGALRTLQDQPYGPWLLGLIAVGVFAFGIYGTIQAVYRRVPAQQPA